MNTTTVPKLREQLNLAYRSGIDRIWIINVGDLKPKEMPISFIMDYAWDPECVDASNTDAWLRQWTASVLGGAAAEDTKELPTSSLTIRSTTSGANPRCRCRDSSTMRKCCV